MTIIELTKNALTVLEKRYLLRDENKKPLETPEGLFKRVADFIGETDEEKEKFFELMATLRFLPNSPTLMNSGTKLGMLSACFVLPVEDDMTSIFDAVKNSALIHQGGGGTGFSFSKIRPKNDVVKTTGGVASGPISFIEVFNAATNTIKQGGCVATDSLIRTDTGSIPIGELLNCPPLSDNPTKSLVYDGEDFNHAYISMDNSIAEVIKITTDIGIEIKPTYNHLIASINEEGDFVWKEAENLKVGDWLVVSLDGHCGSDALLPSIKKQHHNANPIVIPEKITPELGEILGLYMADGCISTQGRIVFSLGNKDPDLIQRIKDLMIKTFNLPVGMVDDKNTYSDLFFYSKDLCKYFEKMNWKKTSSADAFVPQIIFQSSISVAKSFIRGLFSGDGDVHVDGYPRYHSISGTLVKKLQQLLLGLGVVSSISLNKNRLGSFGDKPIYCLSIVPERSLKIFKDEIGFEVSRKNNLLRERFPQKAFEYVDYIPHQGSKLKQKYNYVGAGTNKGRTKRGADKVFYRAIYHYISKSPNSYRNLTRKRLLILFEKFPFLREDSHFKEISNPRYYYSQVRSIEKEDCYTMDIEVSGSNKFVANGVLVHNRRRGANMGILRVDHPDILEFISCKEDQTKLTNFNISIAITDVFMKAVEENTDYDLVNPRNKEIVGKLDAKSVFDKIVEMAWKNGEPGMVFIDRINRDNPTPEIGKIDSTNPCGEQPLLSYESCNLGSINLLKHVKDSSIDWSLLEDSIRLAVRFLDNVIDKNQYVLPEIEQMTKSNRKIGLGIMGFADVLVSLGISYNSKKALDLADKIMSFIQEKARDESSKLGKERGNFPNFEKSIYKDSYEHMRNATTTTIAPTGTISLIAGCSSGVEPYYAIAFTRNVLDGKKLFEANPLFEEQLKVKDIYSEELLEKVASTNTIQELEEIPKKIRQLFVTTHDITPADHIEMQAVFQNNVDNAVSKTINFSSTATKEDISESYLLAYKKGCKGITVYRDGSRKYQVLSTKKDESKTKIDEQLRLIEKLEPRERPEVTVGQTHKIRAGCGNLYVTINRDDEGVCEVFVQVGKSGGCIASQSEAVGRLISLSLRSGVKVESVVDHLAGIRCPSPNFYQGKTVLSCADGISQVLANYINGDHVVKHNGIIACPDCGGMLDFAEGCYTCRLCGYSKCD